MKVGTRCETNRMRVRRGLVFGRSRRCGQRELCPVEKNASLVEQLLQQLAGTFGIELRSPRMGASKCSANSSTYFVKLVSKMWSEKSSSFLSV